MKKHLALVLALVMALTSFSFVSAAPDFADVAGTEFENAVKRLELLEILKGYPDGSFKPEDQITRAEFATVAVRAKGLAGVAATSAGLPSGFSDVPAWHWAAGFVGTAASTGVVNGIGNGLFAPEAPVKYEEAVTMLVRALGYEPEAQTKGGYPYGYLVVAEEIGLLDGARSTTGTFATRGLVALLTDNAMEIPMMVSIGFGDNVRWVVSGSKEHGGDEVYLLHSLGVDEFEGIVMENFHVNSRLDADEIKFYDLNDEKNVTLEVTGSVDVNAILGLEVTAWAKDDVVFAVTVDTDADLMAYDSIKEAKEKEVGLVVLDDTFDWAVRDEDYKDATVYVNNEKKDVEDAKGFGRVVMNDDDEIVFAYLFDIDANNYGVVVDVSDTDLKYISVGSEKEDLLELDEAEEIYVFNKEFAAMSIDDVEKDMSVFFWIDSDDNYFIVAFEAMVEGELEEVRTRDSRITVEGTNYSLSLGGAIFSDDEMDSFDKWTSYALVEDYVDENVVVYLDYNGRAMVMVTDDAVSSDVYGLATWVNTTGRTNTLTVFNAEGEEVTYDFESRSMPGTFFDDVKKTNSPDAIGVMVELNKDAEITTYSAIKTPVNATKDSDKEFINVGTARKYITKDTVILKAYNTKGELKPSVIKYEDLVDLSFTSTAVLLIESEGNDLGLLVFTDPGFTATDETMYAIATGDRFVRAGDYRIEFDVAGEGKAVYTLASSDAIKKGDLVTFEIDNNGEASFNVVKSLGATTSTVTETLRNFIEVEGDLLKVNADTLFYKTADDSNTKLDGTTSFARIDENDEVLVLDNGADKEAKVVVVVTKLRGTTVEVPAGLSLSGDLSAVSPSAVTVKFKNTTTEPIEFNGVTLRARLYDANGGVLTAPTPVTGINKIALKGATIDLGDLNVAALGAAYADKTVTMVVEVTDGATSNTKVLYSVTKSFKVPK